jgi:hypothetical protein
MSEGSAVRNASDTRRRGRGVDRDLAEIARRKLCKASLLLSPRERASRSSPRDSSLGRAPGVRPGSRLTPALLRGCGRPCRPASALEGRPFRASDETRLRRPLRWQSMSARPGGAPSLIVSSGRRGPRIFLPGTRPRVARARPYPYGQRSQHPAAPCSADARWPRARRRFAVSTLLSRGQRHRAGKHAQA